MSPFIFILYQEHYLVQIFTFDEDVVIEITAEIHSRYLSK